jgi:hypothetical protein
MILDGYTQIGGVHPETASLKNVLAYYGVTAPHTGAPYNEATLFGIGGGLGVGYILWEFKSEAYPILVLGFSNRWNYAHTFMENLCRRLGVDPQFHETGGKVKAARRLEGTLGAGDPAILWSDLHGWTYDHHHLLSVVTAFGIDEEQDEVLVDDRARRPVRVPRGEFAAARAEVPSYKHRQLVIAPPEGTSLETAIMEGLRDGLDYLGSSSDTFALPALRKWARLLTDRDHKKGWPTVFAHREGLYSALKSIYEGIELAGTGGGGLRGLYADFLIEAGEILGNPELEEVSEGYRAAAEAWTRLAHSALPDHVEELRRTRELLRSRLDLFLERGSEAREDIQALDDQLAAMKRDFDPAFPAGERQARRILLDMQEQLHTLYKVESEALNALEEAV